MKYGFSAISLSARRRTFLLLIFILFLTILGTEAVNAYASNVLLICALCLIASLPLLALFGSFIPEEMYPLVIFVASLALLYQTSLISNQLIGPDIHQEYYLANLVKMSSRWDSTIAYDYNAMLSIVMLAPILSIVSGMNLIWVFKIIYPLLFSFVPLVLYQVFQKQIGEKPAFLSTFFLISVVTFYTEMIGAARQEIAEIFLALIIFLVAGTKITITKKTALLTIFIASLILSHYGSAFLFVSSLIGAAFVIPFITRMHIHQRENRVQLGLKPKRTVTMVAFIFLACVLMLAWYTYTASSSTLVEIVNVNYRIANSFFVDFLNPEAAQGLNLIMTPTPSVLHDFAKMLQILMQLFVIVGFFSFLRDLRKPSLRKYIKMNFNLEYASLSLIFLLLLVAAIAVPFLASSLNTTRLYHIALLLLAPFSVIGSIASFGFSARALSPVLGKTKKSFSTNTALKVLSVLLALFLLFNVGVIYELSKDHPSSISLSQNWIQLYGDAEEKAQFYNMYTPSGEVASAIWISQHKNNDSFIYSDYRARNNALNAYAMQSRVEGHLVYSTLEMIPLNSYVYLRKLNLVDGFMGGASEVSGSPDIFNATTTIYLITQEASKIYCNGESDIFYTVDTVKLKP